MKLSLLITLRNCESDLYLIDNTLNTLLDLDEELTLNTPEFVQFIENQKTLYEKSGNTLTDTEQSLQELLNAIQDYNNDVIEYHEFYSIISTFGLHENCVPNQDLLEFAYNNNISVTATLIALQEF